MIRAISCLAAVAILAGCGKQVGSETTVEKRSGRVAVAGVHEWRYGGDVAAEELARHRKMIDQSWAPPRMVGTVAGKRLPASTLMQVEITFYPDISCAPGSSRAAIPNDPERGPPMGAGGTVFFPAYQNCAMTSPAGSELVPRQVFFHGGALRIGALTPFTARVVDACPADFVVRKEVLRTHHIPFWRAGFGKPIPTTIDRTRTTASVSAHCPGGDAVFTLGPFVSDTPYEGHDDPAPSLTATLPPEPTRNPR